MKTQSNQQQSVVVLLAMMIILMAFKETSGNNSTPAPDSSEDDSGTVGTYRSPLEALLEDLGSLLPSGNKTFVGKAFSEVLDQFEDKVHAIVPGTKWCGAGNDAATNNSLGTFNDTDNCCRNHDNCPKNILAGESRGRLKNNGIFTRSWCQCDHDFYQCLKKVDSVVGAAIGDTYFNILRPQCFDEYYPITSCAKHDSRLINKKCLQYNYDKSQKKILEWFDNPNY